VCLCSLLLSSYEDYERGHRFVTHTFQSAIQINVNWIEEHDKKMRWSISGQVSELWKESFEKHNYIKWTVRVDWYQITPASILLRNRVKMWRSTCVTLTLLMCLKGKISWYIYIYIKADNKDVIERKNYIKLSLSGSYSVINPRTEGAYKCFTLWVTPTEILEILVLEGHGANVPCWIVEKKAVNCA